MRWLFVKKVGKEKKKKERRAAGFVIVKKIQAVICKFPLINKFKVM